MREIKFRGKTINGIWIYGSLVNNLWCRAKDRSTICEIVTGTGDNDCWEDIAQDDSCIITVNPKTVGQFTGLKDKKGKEIYEGDIVDMELWGVCIIVWNKEISAFQYAYHAISRGTAIGGRVTNTLYDHESVKFEVIGNIYDNPELLTGGKK